MSSVQKSEYSRKTAWLFKRKMQVAMSQAGEKKLKGNVDVDETVLGFHTDRAHCGRNLEEREALMVAVEVLDDERVGNIRIKQIHDFSADTLGDGINEMIEPDAKLSSDGFKSYHTLNTLGYDTEIISAKKVESHKQINRQIMLFKHWLKGIHHKWTEKHLQAYTDEYTYRFNRRNYRKRIFHSIVKRIMNSKPHPYPVLTSLCDYST